MTDFPHQWTAIAPGVMSLPTTQFEIRVVFEPIGIVYEVWCGNIKINATMSLDSSKSLAARAVADLIECGIEP